MDWLQVLTIAGSTIGACWWLSREHKQNMQETRDEIKDFKKAWQQESKDFHGRLCALEEKYIQMMQRILEKNKP